MTPQLLDCIVALRRKNYSYRFIGDTLGIPLNTVKSICYRHGIIADGPRKTKREKRNAPLCKWCHMPLSALRSSKEFCSDDCRKLWWKHNKPVIEISKKKP